MKKLFYTLLALAATLHTQAQCTDLFFSEYIEGSSNNKALEIYNPSAGAVNLSNYRVQLYSNGNTTPGNTLSLSGTLNPGAVYVIANASANDSIKTKADTTSGVANFNGDDAIVLLLGSDTLDIIGVIGVDPGTSWTVDSGTTANFTLVRKQSVQQGTKNWALSSTQWDVLPQDTIRLGFHTMDPCGAVTDTIARFSPTAASVSESAGTYQITLALNTASPSTSFTVDVALTGGTGSAADINNYTTQTATFAPNSTQASVTLTITDDATQEGAETLVFTLQNPSAPLLLGADSVFTLTIGASDVPVLSYTISQVTGLDTTFQPDSLGVKVRLTGTVLGINYRAAGLEFFMHDATDGIGVFVPAGNFGYTVEEGDSVLVEGEIGFFNGVTQVRFLDTVYQIGTGVVPTPLLVQDLGENTEAELVRLNGVSLVTPSQWTQGSTSGFNCDITDGQSTFTLRIDENCPWNAQPAPTGTFDVIGIGSQFDASSPYNSGYQIMPRFQSDIIVVSSVRETELSGVSIYPNPANGQLNVLTPGEGTYNFTLTEITGRTVFTHILAERVNALNITGIVPGTYIAEVRNNQQVKRQVVMVK